MNIQEREEMEFGDGYANESERLFAVERITECNQVVNRGEVAKLSSYGFYVVIAKYARYGSNTDAYLGRTEEIGLVTRSLFEVENYIEDEDYEFVVYEVVYPEAPNGGK